MSKVLGCIMGIICIMSLNKRIVLVNNYERLPNRWRMMLDTYGDGEELMNKLQRLQDDSLYCISVDNAIGCITTACVGMNCIDNELKSTYMSIDELPDWVKGKIAVLNMVDLIKDSNGQEYSEIIDGVGYRLGSGTYYITR